MPYIRQVLGRYLCSVNVQVQWPSGTLVGRAGIDQVMLLSPSIRTQIMLDLVADFFLRHCLWLATDGRHDASLSRALKARPSSGSLKLDLIGLGGRVRDFLLLDGLLMTLNCGASASEDLFQSMNDKLPLRLFRYCSRLPR